jgi:hypothetical protein
MRKSNAAASSERNKGNQYYLLRGPASDELKKLRSTNASNSRWVNNGTEERFSKDHEFLILNGFQYGRLPFNEVWIEKISKNFHSMHTPEANKKKSIALKNRPKSESHKANLKESRKKIPKVECVHCGKIVNQINYSKWHGENCIKIKPRSVVECEHCGAHATYANYKRWHGTNCRRITLPSADSS